MPHLLKVAKFGGTSMADAGAMRRCADIVSADPDKKVLVVSATSGTTNSLVQLFQSRSLAEKKSITAALRQKHQRIADELNAPEELHAQLNELFDELEALVSENVVITPALKDQIYSFGERSSSMLFVQALLEAGEKAVWFDARRIVKTDALFGQAEPDLEAIEEHAQALLLPELEATQRIVTQGFLGSAPDGRTTTLGRGGSDYSAALIAEGAGADVLEIWTDVTAIYTTDPRIEKDARPINEISFEEAAELSVFGAKVLHPATLKPAIRKGISVYVGSSMQPDTPGTWIVKNTSSHPVIRAISLRRKQTLLNVHSLDMLHRYGFLARLFGVFDKHKISVDLVTTSEVRVSITLDTDMQSAEQNHLSDEVLDELRTFCDVDIEKNLALVALVGNNLHATSGLSGPLFGALKDVNIRLICHGASSHNICFLVDEKDAEKAVRILHRECITHPFEIIQ